MGIADNKHDSRIINKHNKDMTPLFGQFAAYIIKFNTTFGFTKVLFGGCPNFSKNTDLINHFLLFYQQAMSSLHIYACVRIFRLGVVDLAKNCNVTVDMSKNVHSYVISHNLFKIYEVNVI